MLLSFSIENFRSFQAEETLNLLAAKRLETKPPHCCEIPGTGEDALRVVSLYGANGAGKSNLVRALDYLQRRVLKGTPPGEPIPYKPFLLDDESPTKPSSFELQFLADGEVFRYGACFDAERVHEEWLAVYEGKKERNLFTRSDNEDGAVEVKLGKGVKHPKKIRALEEVSARPNQLFLTEVVNLDDPEAQGPRFQKAIEWFVSTLMVVEADTHFRTLAEAIATNDAFAKFASNFLREANTGIANLGVRTTEIPSSELSSSSSVTSEVVSDSSGMVGEIDHDNSEGFETPFRGPDLSFDRSGKDAVKVRRIFALHDTPEGEPIQLPLQEESDGSRRLLELLPALYHLATEGGVFVVDELERSMHPMLARKFVEFFLKVAVDTKSQLIFTTHESTLLDLELVSRDGIWFVEKDPKGATHLFSLADFKVRKDLRIEKGYLAGRFGAIPFLGGIDHLIEERATAEAEG